jgi:hypothetical protein
MAFPDGWPPRPATGQRSLRFYLPSTVGTANFSDRAYLFSDGAGANPFTPTPSIPAGAGTVTPVGGTGPGAPSGSGQAVRDALPFHAELFQRGTGGSSSFTIEGTAATGNLNGTANFADGEQIVIDAKTYTIQATLTNVDGNIQLGGSLAITLANIENAINLGPGAGTAYAAAMTLHPTVSATSTATDLNVTAKAVGTPGNSIVTTTTAANATWTTGGTLVGGTGSGISILFRDPNPSPRLFDQGLVGKDIRVLGATTPGNDGTFRILSVSADGKELTWNNAAGASETFAALGTYRIRRFEDSVPKTMIWADTIRVINSGGGDLEISFDGENVHGLVPSGATHVYRGRNEAGIAVRGNGVTFVIEAW